MADGGGGGSDDAQEMIHFFSSGISPSIFSISLTNFKKTSPTF
jgi:hypothetical protein